MIAMAAICNRADRTWRCRLGKPLSSPGRGSPEARRTIRGVTVMNTDSFNRLTLADTASVPAERPKR
jgi:hypothetical protein